MMDEDIESLVWDILNDGEVDHCVKRLRAALDAVAQAAREEEREACIDDIHSAADIAGGERQIVDYAVEFIRSRSSAQPAGKVSDAPTT